MCSQLNRQRSQGLVKQNHLIKHLENLGITLSKFVSMASEVASHEVYVKPVKVRLYLRLYHALKSKYLVPCAKSCMVKNLWKQG